MSITSYPVYSLSTIHLAPQDEHALRNNRLKAVCEINAGFLGATPFGLLLWIGAEGLSEPEAATLQSKGFTPNFARLIERVHKEASGLCYVLLSEDGETVAEDLPTFKR
jgi:hypothetical protein